MVLRRWVAGTAVLAMGMTPGVALAETSQAVESQARDTCRAGGSTLLYTTTSKVRGGEVVYTTTVSNQGDRAARGASFTVDLLDVIDDAELVSVAGGARFDLDVPGVTWRGDVGAGEKVGVTWTMRAGDGGDGRMPLRFGSTDAGTCAAAKRKASQVCTNEAYLTNDSGDLYRFDPQTSKATLIKAGVGLATFGYNRLDGMLYGWPRTASTPVKLMIVDPRTGDATTREVKNLPNLSYISGTISPVTKQLYLQDASSSLQTVDVDPASPTYMTFVKTLTATVGTSYDDLVANPADGKLYGVDDSNSGAVWQVDPTTGASKNMGTTTSTGGYYRAGLTDAAGNLTFVDFGGSNNRVIRVDLTKGSLGGYTTQTALSGATGTVVDGAACYDPVDYGDAPASYGSAGHDIDPKLGIGATIDAENAAQPSAGADGDDKAGINDEDAFSSAPTVSAGAPNLSLDVPVKNTTGAAATLAGWVDFDANGKFEAAERATVAVADKAATAKLTWASLPAMTRGVTFSRFRILPGSVSAPDPTGRLDGGEVEDHEFQIGGVDEKKCDGSYYVSGAPVGQTATRLYRQNPVTGARTDIPLTYKGSPSAIQFDALAYNSGNGQLYAVRIESGQQNKLITIDPGTGVISDLTVRPNAKNENLPNIRYYQGTITPDGTRYFMQGDTTNGLQAVDVDVRKGDTPRYVGKIGAGANYWDMAVNPADGLIYSMSGTSLARVDPATGASTTLTTLTNSTPNSAVAFDTVGNLYATGSDGKVVQIDLTKKGVQGKDLVVGQTDKLNTNDTNAAGCIVARDYGDAARPYETKGVSHVLTAGLGIGADTDAEFGPDSQQPLDFLNDDTMFRDDEDGIATEPLIAHDTDAPSVDVTVRNTTDGPATLAGWLDVNLDGAFQPFERARAVVAKGATKATLTWPGLRGKYTGKRGTALLRLRLFPGDLADPAPDGDAPGGEVEDHRAYIGGVDLKACDDTFYVSGSGGSGEPTRLYKVDQTTGKRTPIRLTYKGKTSLIEFNAMAYNPGDGLLYGARQESGQQGKLVTVDPATGEIEQVTIQGLPAVAYKSGAITPDGSTYYLQGLGGTVHAVDIAVDRGNTPAYLKQVSTATGNTQDLAVNPFDGKLYGLDNNRIWRYDQDKTSGNWTELTPALSGASAVTNPSITFDNLGNLRIAGENGSVVELDLTKGTRGKDVRVGTTQTTTNSDGAGCVMARDFGDAPASYPVASHVIVAKLLLGADLDAEPGTDTQNPLDYTNDDTSLRDDEDAIANDLAVPYDTDAPSTQVTVGNTTAGAATLAGWLDANLNGTFEAAERATANVAAGKVGQVELKWSGLRGKYSGRRGIGALRLRLYGGAEADPQPGGAAASGETEDHRALIGGQNRKVCDDLAYVTGAPNGQPTKLYKQAIGTGVRTEIALTYAGEPSTLVFNALGYDTGDGRLYAARQESGQLGKLIEIDPATGEITDLPITKNASGQSLPALAYTQGAVSPDGNTYYLASAGGRVQRVDVDSAGTGDRAYIGENASNTSSLGDFSMHPVDGKLYGLNSNTLTRQEPVSGSSTSLGTITTTGTYSGVIFDTLGNLYAFNDAGSTVQIDLTKITGGLATKGKDVLVGKAGSITNADAAGCVTGVDYGDAPDSYNTRASNNGASHKITDKLRLGADLDANPDADSQAPLNGFADDLNDGRDDEDGVTGLRTVKITDTTYSVNAAVHNDTGERATVAAWIDFNNDGAFSTGERATAPAAVGDTTVPLTWSGLSGLKAGVTYLRVRLLATDVGDPQPVGKAVAGEVEDYRIAIRAGAEKCPNTTYVSSGARLFELNLATGGRTEIPLTYNGATSTVPLNALAYNSKDGLLYAGRTDQAGKLVLIDPGMGTVTDLAILPNATGQTLAANPFDQAGITPDGTSLFLAQTGSSRFIQQVDLTDLSAPRFVRASTIGSGLGDFAVNPMDGKLYGATGTAVWQADAATNTSKKVADIASVTNPGAVFDNLGNLYLIGENGVIVQMDLTKPAAVGRGVVVGKTDTFTAGDATGCLEGADFGDAPDTYTTGRADGGPYHRIVSGLSLGADVDADPNADTQNTLDALNDDTKDERADEDGLTAAKLEGGKLKLDVALTAGAAATLAGWLDTDGDGTFGASERVTVPVAAGQTTAALAFDAPAASDKPLYSRLRLFSGTVADPRPIGGADGGEVEDHRISTANLKVTKSGWSRIGAGSAQSYRLTVTNAGPSAVTAAKLTDTVAAEYTGVSWSCAATGGAACATSSGSGNALNLNVNVPVGGKITVTVTGSTKAADAGKTVPNSAEIAVPAGTVDLDPDDNKATTSTDLTRAVTCRSGYDLCINSAGPPVRDFDRTADGRCGIFVSNSKQYYADCYEALVVDNVRYGNRSPEKTTTLIDKGSVTGAGTKADPYTIFQKWQAGDSGFEYTVTDSYVEGSSAQRTTIDITNNTGQDKKIRFYRAVDCYLAGNDSGYSAVTFLSDGRRAPACIGYGAAAGQVEQFIPATPDNEYYVGAYGGAFTGVDAKTPLQNQVSTTGTVDNGMAIAWEITIPAGSTQTLAFDTLITQQGEPRVSLTASVDPAEVVEGRGTVVTYTITAGSPTPLDVVPDELSFPLPAGFTYVRDSTDGDLNDNPDISGQTLTWPSPFEIPGEGAKTFTFKVKVGEGVAPGDYPATATGKLGQYLVGPPLGQPNANKTSVKVTPRPDVAVTAKSVPAGPLAPGVAFNAEVTVSNNGLVPVAAGTTTVAINLPENTVLAGALPSGCTNDAGTITCAVPVLAVKGNSQVFTLPLKIASDAPLDTQLGGGIAQISNADDGTPANNSAAIAMKTTATASTDLQMTVVAPTDPIPPGGTGTLIVRVRNNGPSSSRADAPVTVTFPQKVTSAGCAPCTVPSGLAAGAEKEFSIPFTVGSDAPLDSTLSGGSATVTLPGDTVAGNNSAPFTLKTTATAQADLAVAVAPQTGPVAPGATTTVKVTVTNEGPSDSSAAANVVITLPSSMRLSDPLPAGCTAVGQKATCALPNPLAAKGSAVFTFAVKVVSSAPLATDLTGSAKVSGTQDVVPGNDTAPFTIRTTDAANLDLAIDVVPPAALPPGGTGTLTVKVANRGPSDTVAATTVTVTLPDSVTLQTGAPCVAAGQTVTCTIPAGHAVATDKTFDLPVKIAANAVAGTPLTGGQAKLANADDRDGTNNAKPYQLAVGPAVTGMGVTVAAIPDAPPGANATVPVTISNAGPSDSVSATMVTFTLPSNVTAAAPLPAGCVLAATKVTCTIPAGFGAGTTKKIDLPVKIASNAPLATELTGGQVTVSNAEDPTDSSAAIAMKTTGNAVSDLAIDVTAPAALPPGSESTLTARVSNLGPSDTRAAATATVTLPAGVSVSGALPAACTASGQKVTCTVTAGLAAGIRSSFRIPVRTAQDTAADQTLTGGEGKVSLTGDPVPGNDSVTFEIGTGAAVSDLGVLVDGTPYAPRLHLPWTPVGRGFLRWG
ncbi:DUF6923 family protein [Nonomuraea sp. NPDC050556]|uniref:DUF6923 family protein n=1 Tax=Nonomuraea sp. NPDC050556 TaxID=3364369 RepID=UPI003792C395